MKTGQDRDVLPPVWTSQTALERYGLWRKRVSGQGPPGGQPAPAEAFGKAKPAVSETNPMIASASSESVHPRCFQLWRKRVSGQGPSGGQPAPAEAFGKAKPAVSDIRRRPIPSKTDTLAREGQVIDQPGLSQPGCTQDTRFGWPFRPAFGQVRQVR